MVSAKQVFVLSLVGAAALVVMLDRLPESPAVSGGGPPLIVYCAVALKPALDAAARAYQARSGVAIQPQYGGSGTLLSNLRVAQRGDLFLPADGSYLEMARRAGLVSETVPVARMTPVIGVRVGNPQGIRRLADLRRGGLRVALANPDAAAIGKVVRELLIASGDWPAFSRRITVFQPTVDEVANDIRLGTVDAGIVWDATVRQFTGLAAVADPLLSGGARPIGVGVLRCSTQPAAALALARFLGAADAGGQAFAAAGYAPPLPRPPEPARSRDSPALRGVPP